MKDITTELSEKEIKERASVNGFFYVGRLFGMGLYLEVPKRGNDEARQGKADAASKFLERASKLDDHMDVLRELIMQDDA